MSTLEDRINDYLRDKLPVATMQVAEADRSEYLLKRAEDDLKRARERLEKIQHELAEGNTSAE